MKEFVEYIVKHLVDNPEAVSVSEVVGETTVVYELKVDQPDMGKVIGIDLGTTFSTIAQLDEEKLGDHQANQRRTDQPQLAAPAAVAADHQAQDHCAQDYGDFYRIF